MDRRSLAVLAVVLGMAVFALSCASGPRVISSSPDRVEVELPTQSSVSRASVLAQKACKAHGKVAAFDSVDATASRRTRVARFHCVSADGGAGSSDRD